MNIILTIIGVAILVGIMLVLSNTKAEVKAKKYAMSFKEAMDLISLPVVTFRNNGQKLHFLLDTGSDDSYINSSVLPLLNIKKKVGHKREIITGNGITTSEGTILLEIEYKNLRLENVFIISNMGDAFDELAEERGVKVHGILGSKFFNQYGYKLDFENLTAYTSKL